MVDASSESFYADLPVFEDFADISSLEKYAPVPDDWQVVVSDVQGSTAAIKAGRYKDVNLIGASSIISVLNASRPSAIPYIFGGDGATLCVPTSLADAARQALRATQKLAKEEFGLPLRAGVVPVQVIRNAGFSLNVAKFRMSSEYVQAAFAGGGLQYAERLIKDEHAGAAYRIEEHVGQGLNAKGDFSGLECRWDNIPSAHGERGEIVTLLVQACGNDPQRDASTYRSVLHMIADIYGQSAAATPAVASQMKLTFESEKLRGEALVRMAGRSAVVKTLYLLLMKFQLIFGKLFIDRGWHVGGIDWRKYKQDVIANTDYRKFDDLLRHVLSGTREQRTRLTRFLDDRFERGDLVYGLHTAQAALMTCLIFQRDGGHVHFVDGADGGYALAAEDLKRRLRCELNARPASVSMPNRFDRLGER